MGGHPERMEFAKLNAAFRQNMPHSTRQDLTRSDWTLIESKAKRKDYKLGLQIIKEGARIDHLYVLRDGAASIELEERPLAL